MNKYQVRLTVNDGIIVFETHCTLSYTEAKTLVLNLIMREHNYIACSDTIRAHQVMWNKIMELNQGKPITIKHYRIHIVSSQTALNNIDFVDKCIKLIF